MNNNLNFIISFDVIDNKIYLNNIHNIKFDGYIVIKYYNNIVYKNNLKLDNYGILWFSPYTKIKDISNIIVELINSNQYLQFNPMVYTSFMRDTDIEIKNVCDFINKNNNIKNIVEIGSYQGESTILFNKFFPETNIFAVDIWDNNYDNRESNINSHNMIDVENNFDIITKNIKNIIKIKKHSNIFSDIIKDNSIDFVYIDADHSYKGVSNDIIKWKDKVKIGGFIGGHDYNDFNKNDVVKAVKENFEQDKIKIFGDSWIVIK